VLRGLEKEQKSLLLRDAAVGIAVAAAVFALSYANGGFAPTTRSYAAIAAWWLLGIGAAIGIASAWAGVSRLALVAVGLLSAFAIWILISVNWAADVERAFEQFNQISLYVAIFVIATVISRIVPAYVLVGGVAAALSALAGVALVSRFFPSVFGTQPGLKELPPLVNRLSFPLGYWNGLGIEVALAYPLLLSIMVSRRSRVVSSLAAFPLPLIAGVMYLTSSRGAFVAALVALIAFVALTPRRWPVVAALAVALAAGAVSVAALVHKRSLVNGLMDTSTGVHQGHQAALVIGIACVVTSLVWLGLMELGKRVPTPSRRAGQITAVSVAVLVVLAVALSHPVAKFDDFKSNSSGATGSSTVTTSHLLSSSGSGRWQFWGAAIDEFKDHPLNGGGAGSWGAWWLEHGSLRGVFTQYAHSLYLEALGELGIIGFLLIAGFVVVAVVGSVRSALALGSSEIAAAAACGIAFFAAASYDWVWQLGGIAVVGIGMLGIALGALPSARPWGRAGVIRPAVAVVAVAAIIPQFVILVANTHLDKSRAAYTAGDATEAQSQALAANAIEPWSASPYLQLGLISERLRDYAEASQWLDKAISRSRRDWQLWAIAARIEGERAISSSGAESRKALRRARRDADELRRLNPGYATFKQAS
jgi:O-antigen ligase/polysaccharide polymerase Wzy-like membrane protein